MKATQNEIISYIEEMNERLNDSKQREIYEKHYLKISNKRNTEKRYQIITMMVNDKYGKGTISDTTVWRILKIQQTSLIAFNQIKEGECSVKNAYIRLFPSPEKKLEESSNISSLGDLKEYIIKLNTYYKENLDNMENPPVKEMRALDDELFKLRKMLNNIIAKAENFDEL